jgi:3-oxoacyl-[acyl-carrier-protein] synthase I
MAGRHLADLRPAEPPVTSRPCPVRVSAYTAVSALGVGNAAHLDAMTQGRSGLCPLGRHDFGARPTAQPLSTWVGRVQGLDEPLPPTWRHWDCRNNRLAWSGLQSDRFAHSVQAAMQRHGAHRVALVLGTSTASIGATEDAYQALAAGEAFPPQPDNPALHTLHSLTGFVQEALALRGPAQTISTACSSSAKAFASAERLIHLGLADAAVVGGVDSLCGSVVFGFHALQLVSPEPCRPFDTRRQGINLGEAAAFALLERGPGGLQLLGSGESSDAHHLSAPDPDGQGAETALDLALARAGIPASAVGYIHLHGTATPRNDDVEARLIARRFARGTPASSTKGMTGHTLGAAGALGAVFSLLALESGVLPGTAQTESVEPGMRDYLNVHALSRRVDHVVSHAFAFGGSNSVLVFGCAPGGCRA